MPSDVPGILPVHWGLVLFIAIAAFAVNVPLGWLREGVRKLSPAWFLYVHLSIPLIAGLRIFNHLSGWLIPPFIACAVGGQLVGGRLRKHRASRP